MLLPVLQFSRTQFSRAEPPGAESAPPNRSRRMLIDPAGTYSSLFQMRREATKITSAPSAHELLIVTATRQSHTGITISIDSHARLELSNYYYSGLCQ